LKIIYKILLLAFIASFVKAQGGGSLTASDAVSASMGNSFVVKSNGIFSIGKNPANLVKNNSNFFEFSVPLPFPSFNGSFGSTFLSINEYNYFFTGQKGIDNNSTAKLLTTSDKERLITLLKQGNGVNMQLDFNLLAFAINFGKKSGMLAFAVSDHSVLTSELPVSLFELFLFGNEAGRSYSFKDTQLKSWYLRNYSLTYSNDLSNLTKQLFKSFSVGLSVKLVQGYFYTNVERMKTYFETTPEIDSVNVYGDFLMRIAASPDIAINYDFETGPERNSNLSLFPAPAGKGFGFDFGVNAQLDDVWAVAASITDIGSLKWDNITVEYESNSNFFVDDFTEEVSIDSLMDVLRGEGKYVSSFSTPLASALHLGIGCDFGKLLDYDPDVLNVVFEYHQGFNNMPSNSTNARFALGLEWKALDILPIRSGFSFGGIHTFNWSFGFGLDLELMEMNFATGDFNELVRGNNSNRVGVSFSSRWKI
jgi:uncharacterized protein DUF5723